MSSWHGFLSISFKLHQALLGPCLRPHVHDKRRAYRHGCRRRKSKSWLKARCFVDSFNAKRAEPRGQAARSRHAASTPLSVRSHTARSHFAAVRHADAAFCTRQADGCNQRRPFQTSQFPLQDSRRCRASLFRKSSLRPPSPRRQTDAGSQQLARPLGC